MSQNLAASISDVDQQLRKQQLDEALFHTQAKVGSPGLRGGGASGVRSMAAARSLRTQRAARPSTTTHPNTTHPSTAPDGAMRRKQSRAVENGSLQGSSRPATVDTAEIQNAQEYCNLSALISHRAQQQQQQRRAYQQQQQHPQQQEAVAAAAAAQQPVPMSDDSHSNNPPPRNAIANRSTADSSWQRGQHGAGAQVPAGYENWGFSSPDRRYAYRTSDPSGIAGAAAGGKGGAGGMAYPGGSPPGTASRNLRRLPTEPASTAASARLYSSLGSFHTRYINQPSSAEVLVDRRLSTAPHGQRSPGQQQPHHGGSRASTAGGCPRVPLSDGISLFEGGGKPGSAHSPRMRDNSLAPCTVLQLPVPESSLRSPRASPRRNENPFNSDINSSAGPSGQRDTLNIRLPIAANNSSGAADMISNLFRRLNSVRDGPRSANDHPFEGSLQQQEQQQQQGPSTRTMLEMLIGNQMPTNRRHAEIVEEWFEDRVAELIPDGLSSLGGERAADLVDGPKWERLMHACGTGMATLIQQAGIHCYERGAVMAEIWNCYTALHDLRTELMEESLEDIDNRRKTAGAKADRFQSDSAAYQTMKVDMQRLRVENDEMRSRISVIEGERDEYMKRMVDLEDSVAMSDLRASKMQMLKNFTLKKFVDVASDKVALRTEEVEILARDVKERRFKVEGLLRKINILTNHVQDAVKLTDMLPPSNQIRAAVVAAAESGEEAFDLTGELDKAADEVTRILEGGDEVNDLLSAQGLDSESFFALVKSTVDMFQLDLDPNVIYENFKAPSGALKNAEDRHSSMRQTPRSQEEAEDCSSSHGSAPGDDESQGVAQGSSMMLSEDQQQHEAQVQRHRSRVNFGPNEAAAPPTLQEAIDDSSEGINVDMSDMIDADMSDVLKEVARLRRHLLEMDRQQTALSRRGSGMPEDNKAKLKRMMSLASMKSLLARSSQGTGSESDVEDEPEEPEEGGTEGEGNATV